MRRALIAALGLLFFLSAAPRAGAQIAVDLALVLAVDCSTSVTDDEFALMMEGYAAAFRDARVRAAIRSGPQRAIAVTLIEFSNTGWQRIAADWRVAGDDQSTEELAKLIETSSRLVYGGGTSISGAIDYAARLLDRAPYAAERRAIDVSGDGKNNQGRRVTTARDAAVARGMTINGLAILHEEPDIESYYRDEVIGGEHAFVMMAQGYADFAAAIARKLQKEIEVPIASNARFGQMR